MTLPVFRSIFISATPLLQDIPVKDNGNTALAMGNAWKPATLDFNVNLKL